MLFSSITFIFIFLPLTMAIYFAIPGLRLKNIWLLFASLCFYAYGEGLVTTVLLFYIIVNYLAGLALGRAPEKSKRLMLFVGIGFNLALLLFFKYSNFAAVTFNEVRVALGLLPLQFDPVHLPLGISFFTFQGISYLVDINRGRVKAQRSLINFALFKAFFPQLIAGPIVRYQTVSQRLSRRFVDPAGFAYGAERFTIGLAKKTLVANNMAIGADQIFALSATELTAPIAWFGLFCYTLQIYFDFSGYSDMAIGLGRMFGFRFLENFNYPYVANSIRDFWRRWHISLSTWFRDYLYIPLGGNRGSALRTCGNLLIVFVLCGFWHGASWNFGLWGLYHGSFLALERTPFGRLVDRCPRAVQSVYTMLVVMIGWCIFRCESLGQIGVFGTALFGFGLAGPEAADLLKFAPPDRLFWGAVGIIGATPLAARLGRRLRRRMQSGQRLRLVSPASGVMVMAALFFVSVGSLLSGTYNPFIYFRF